MTRTHGDPLIILAEKRPYPVAPPHPHPYVIKYSQSADREAKGWGDNRFYLCKPVSLADHVWGLFTLQGWGMAPGELTPDHTQGCFSCHYSTLPLPPVEYRSSIPKIFHVKDFLIEMCISTDPHLIEFFFSLCRGNKLKFYCKESLKWQTWSIRRINSGECIGKLAYFILIWSGAGTNWWINWWGSESVIMI